MSAEKACCKAAKPAPKPVAAKVCSAPCCQAGAAAKFKVWVGGSYQYFGCKGAAKKAKAEFAKKGMISGGVQKVVGKHLIS
jgi:hypothetical protein